MLRPYGPCYNRGVEVVTKTGLALIRDGALLLCRKRGLHSLILPGGKPEPGEEPLDCLRRELREELGDVELTNAQYIGTYSDVMAGDASKTIEVLLYTGELVGHPVASSEIVELVWFGPDADRAELAPSLAKILPDLIARKLLSWIAA
jgi:8-oxo-dGTP diphosphatase